MGHIEGAFAPPTGQPIAARRRPMATAPRAGQHPPAARRRQPDCPACAAGRWRFCSLTYSRHPARPPDRAAVGARRGDLQRLHAIRHEAPDRHRRRRAGEAAGNQVWWRLRPAVRAGRGRQPVLARRRLCRRTAPSSPSPATSAATCSAICPAMRRPISPNGCPAPGQPHQLDRQRRLHAGEHRRMERAAADASR